MIKKVIKNVINGEIISLVKIKYNLIVTAFLYLLKCIYLEEEA